MNAIVQQAETTQAEVIRVLENSLYPGAKRESIELVLAYCRANGLDPMLKPVHIVPTSIKLPNGNYEMRDVLMPGIADYRIKAARSGEYGGKSEPEFGPDVSEVLGGRMVTYPAWCRVTIRRIVQGVAREFTATERWLENYATAPKSEAPNRMWAKRPYGQLAKCAESQALRMAFPEFSAGYTAEEMEGKTLDGFAGQTIDAEPSPDDRRAEINREVPLRAAAATTQRAPRVADKAPPGARTDDQWRTWLDKLRAACAVLRSRQEVVEVAERSTVGDALATGPVFVQREISAILAENYARFPEDEPAEPDAEDDFPGDLPPVEIRGEDKVMAG